MRILAVIPARGGSKSIPRKNVRDLAGLPLIAYSIKAGHAASTVERLVVSTEDTEIAAVSRYFGAEVIERPPSLAQDDTPTRPVIEHAVNTLIVGGYQRPDAVLTLQPTSPLRTARHIDEAVALYEADLSADSLVSCVPVPHIFHPNSVMKRAADGSLVPYLPGDTITRRQEKEPVFARNGAAIYITRTDRLCDFIFGGRLLSYEMSMHDSVDIDDEHDWRCAEKRLSER